MPARRRFSLSWFFRRASAGDISHIPDTSQGGGSVGDGSAQRPIQRPKRPNRERAYSMSEGGKFAGTVSANGVTK